MDGEKIFVIDGTQYKCIFMYGYNSHHYATVYENETGKYLGQLVDIESDDSDIEKRVKEFVKNCI